MNEFTVGYRQKYTKKFYHKTTGGFPSHNFHPLLPTGKRTPNPPENLRRRSTAPSAPRERYRRGKLVHTARSGRRRHEVRPTAIARHRKSSAAYPVRLYRQRPERPDCYCMPRKSHDIARNGYSYHTNGSHGEEILSPVRNARPPPETTPAPPANRTPGTTPAATATRHRPRSSPLTPHEKLRQNTSPPTHEAVPDMRPARTPQAFQFIFFFIVILAPFTMSSSSSPRTSKKSSFLISLSISSFHNFL